MTAMHNPKQNHLLAALPVAEAYARECQDVVKGGRLMKNPLQLGKREREVLKHLADGFTSSATAKRMFISTSTVEVHRRNIKEKLDLRSIAELTKYAIRNGLTSL